MKVQHIEKGGKHFIRGYFLGFIPIYYNTDFWEDGWSLCRDDMDKEDAEKIIKRWVAQAAEKKDFKKSKTNIITEVYI